MSTTLPPEISFPLAWTPSFSFLLTTPFPIVTIFCPTPTCPFSYIWPMSRMEQVMLWVLPLSSVCLMTNKAPWLAMPTILFYQMVIIPSTFTFILTWIMPSPRPLPIILPPLLFAVLSRPTSMTTPWVEDIGKLPRYTMDMRQSRATTLLVTDPKPFRALSLTTSTSSMTIFWPKLVLRTVPFASPRSNVPLSFLVCHSPYIRSPRSAIFGVLLSTSTSKKATPWFVGVASLASSFQPLLSELIKSKPSFPSVFRTFPAVPES